MVEQVEQTRVAWADTDASGRIHFTAVFRWAEEAETSLLRRLGFLDRFTGTLPRRRAEAEYRKVLRFEDEIETRLQVEKVGRTSVTFAWTIVRDGEPCVKGRHTVVYVNAAGRPEPLPDSARAALDA